MSEDTKKCPYCAETIKKEAIVCRYCGRDIDAVDLRERSELFESISLSDKDERGSAVSDPFKISVPFQIIVMIMLLPLYIPFWLWKRGDAGKVIAAFYILFVLFFMVDYAPDSSETEVSTNRAAETGDLSESGVAGGAEALTATPSATTTPKPTLTPSPTSTPTTTPTATPTPVGSLSVVTTGNLRGGPGAHYGVVATVVAGESLPVYGRTDDGWFQVDGTGDKWIASILISIAMNFSEVPTAESIPPTPTATLTPTSTPTPNRTATSRAEAQAAAATAVRQEMLDMTATVEAYVHSPPVGTWCKGTAVRQVCVGDFRYTNRAGYSSAPANGRFIAFFVAVHNRSDSDIVASSVDVTLVMEDGRTYDYAAETYSYWASPLGVVTVAPGDSAQGGILFLVPNDVAPRRIIYRGGFFEDAVEIDLFERPNR